MDVFQYLEKRDIKITDVFSRNASEPVNDIAQSFRKLGHLFEKKTKTWWDIVSFEQYLTSKLIPRRLRWDVPPNDGLVDIDSISEWSSFFIKKGMELMELLLVRKQRKLKILNSQINDITTILEPLKDSEEFLKLSGELKNKLVKWDSEIQNKKKKKFIRDWDDFTGVNSIFKWQSTSTTVTNDNVRLPVNPLINEVQNLTPRAHFSNDVQHHPPPERYSSPQRNYFTRGTNKRGKNKRGRGRGGSAPSGSVHHPPVYQPNSPTPWRDIRQHGDYRDSSHVTRSHPISTYNRFTPLANHHSYAEGDFLGSRQGHQLDPHYQYPPPGDWWRHPPPPIPPNIGTPRKRKEREEGEGAGAYKKPRP